MKTRVLIAGLAMAAACAAAPALEPTPVLAELHVDQAVPRPEVARTTSAQGCTANWNTTSGIIGFSTGDIRTPYRSCRLYFNCRSIDGTGSGYWKFSSWLNDYEGPIWPQCNNTLTHDVAAVQIVLSTSVL